MEDTHPGVQKIYYFLNLYNLLYCDYNKNKAYVVNTNLKCNITSNDYNDFTYLLISYGCSPYKVEHLIDKNNLSNIKEKNGYLSNNEYGFKINYIN